MMNNNNNNNNNNNTVPPPKKYVWSTEYRPFEGNEDQPQAQLLIRVDELNQEVARLRKEEELQMRLQEQQQTQAPPSPSQSLPYQMGYPLPGNEMSRLDWLKQELERKLLERQQTIDHLHQVKEFLLQQEREEKEYQHYQHLQNLQNRQQQQQQQQKHQSSLTSADLESLSELSNQMNNPQQASSSTINSTPKEKRRRKSLRPTSSGKQKQQQQQQLHTQSPLPSHSQSWTSYSTPAEYWHPHQPLQANNDMQQQQQQQQQPMYASSQAYGNNLDNNGEMNYLNSPTTDPALLRRNSISHFGQQNHQQHLQHLQQQQPLLPPARASMMTHHHSHHNNHHQQHQQLNSGYLSTVQSMSNLYSGEHSPHYHPHPHQHQQQHSPHVHHYPSQQQQQQHLYMQQQPQQQLQQQQYDSLPPLSPRSRTSSMSSGTTRSSSKKSSSKRKSSQQRDLMQALQVVHQSTDDANSNYLMNEPTPQQASQQQSVPRQQPSPSGSVEQRSPYSSDVGNMFSSVMGSTGSTSSSSGGGGGDSGGAIDQVPVANSQGMSPVVAVGATAVKVSTPQQQQQQELTDRMTVVDPFDNLVSPTTTGLQEVFEEYKFPASRSDAGHMSSGSNSNNNSGFLTTSDDDDGGSTTNDESDDQHEIMHRIESVDVIQTQSSPIGPATSDLRASSSSGGGGASGGVKGNGDPILQKKLESFKFGYNSPRTDASPLSVTSTSSFKNAPVLFNNRTTSPSYPMQMIPQQLHQLSQSQPLQQQQQQLQQQQMRQSPLSQSKREQNLGGEIEPHGDDVWTDDEEEEVEEDQSPYYVPRASVQYRRDKPISFNFSTITSQSVLIREIENAAEYVPLELRTELWKTFCSMLKDDVSGRGWTYVGANNRSVGFRHAFLISRVMEKIIEGILLEPDCGDPATLFDLFSYTMVGTHNDHVQLVTLLKSIGRAKELDNPARYSAIVKIATEVVSTFKVKLDEQPQVSDSIEKIDKELIALEEQLNLESTKPQRTSTILAKMEIARRLVHYYNQKRQFVAIRRKHVGLDTVQRFFHHCQQSVGAPIQGVHSPINHQLTQRIANEQQQYTSRIQTLDEHCRVLQKRATQLRDEKNELELRLARVTSQLNEVQTKLSHVSGEKLDLEEKLRIVIAQAKADEVKRRNTQSRNQVTTMGVLAELVDYSRNIILSELAERDQGYSQIFDQCTQNYHDRVLFLLEQQNQAMINILQKKILSCCEKLDHLRNTSRDPQSTYIEKLKRYYDRYLGAEKICIDILEGAERLNRLIHEKDKDVELGDPNFAEFVIQADSQFSILSESENIMIACNKDVQWVYDELESYERQANQLLFTPNCMDSAGMGYHDMNEISHVPSRPIDNQFDRDKLAQIEDFLKSHQANSQEEAATHATTISIPDSGRSRSSSNASNSSSKSSKSSNKIPREVDFLNNDHPRIAKRRSSVSSAMPGHTHELPDPSLLQRRSSVSSAMYHHATKPRMRRQSKEDTSTIE